MPIDPDEEGVVEQEPLVISAALGEEGQVTGLMKAKPSPEVSGRAMIAAARCGHEKVTEILLKHKADVNSEQGALCLDIFIGQHDAIGVGTMFLRYGLRTSSRIAARMLEYASDQGLGHGLKAVQELLKYRLNPTSEMGYKGLQLASQSGHEAIVKTLLDARASPTSRAGAVSLQTASLMGQFKVVKILLEAQGDASSKEGNDALNCAVHIGNDSLVKLLLNATANPASGLPAAAFRGNHKFVQLLLAREADPASKKKALREAARFGHQEIMHTLLQSGVDTHSRAGDAALRLAVSSGRDPQVKSEIVQALVAHGARRMTPSLPALPGSPVAAKKKSRPPSRGSMRSSTNLALELR